MFLSTMERIRVAKINKATVVLHMATPLINGVAGDSGEIVLGFFKYASYPQCRGFDFASK